jgi:DNA mismatch repair protein MutL
MSDVIHLLPDSVANQIAAGEVIQRPASVLKELVENSLDAGATSIKIIIKDAGRTLIQIIDNGKGMSETDARMSFERHATSKISSAEDLFSLKTMGFRGEALASIAAVAQVELRTRRAEDELGVKIEIAGTRVFAQEQIQCEKGTSFTIKNLFFNVPARRRFLKSDTTEKGHILTEFYRIALVNPEVEFMLYDGDEEIFNLPASNHRVRISNVFGKNKSKAWQQQWLSVETSTSIVSIYGYVGKPEHAQKNANQYFFVNGRYMRHPYFHKSVTTAYSQMIKQTDSPNYFIYFDVDPQTIDVNIHPTKTEIKFENEQPIWSILSSAVKEALGKFNILPSIDFDQEGAIQMPSSTAYSSIEPPKSNFNPSYNPFQSTGSSGGYKKSPITSNWSQLYGDFEKGKEIDETSLPIVDSKLNSYTTEHSQSDNSQQIIEHSETPTTKHFQYKQRYILTSIKSGLMMIDQHRAHVRILFDQLMLQMMHHQGNSQQVLFPEELLLSEHNYAVFKDIISELNSIGFDFEKMDEKHYLVKGVPAQMNTGSVLNLLEELIGKAASAASDIRVDLSETIALTMAKNTAIKVGQALSDEEMSDLIDKLFASSNCNNTPDGKLIMTVLTQEDIEGKFGV